MNSNQEEWFEWAAFNLAMGVSSRAICGEVVKHGISTESFDEFLRALDSNPAYKATTKIARKLKLANALFEALTELESQAYCFNAIERVHTLSAENFHKQYYSLNRPVIIENMIENWPALEKWSIPYLRTNFGHHIVKFQANRSKDNHLDAFVDHAITGPFSDFLDGLGAAVTGAPSYLIAHDRLLDRVGFRPLLDDIAFDGKLLEQPTGAGEVFFWLGSAGSATPMHRDLGNVYLAQIVGRKEIKMVPAKQLHLMYNEHGYHSDANFTSLDVDRFPHLKRAYISTTTVQPGDFLFIPAGWWHDVTCLETSITITGNNFAFPNRLTPIF